MSLHYSDRKRIVEKSVLMFNYLKTLNKQVYNYKDCPRIVFTDVEPVLKLYKRDFLVNNNLNFAEGCFFEDTIFHIKCMSLANKICFDDYTYYFYRQNRPGQTTGTTTNTRKFLDIFNYINTAETFFKNNNMWEFFKNYYYEFCFGRFRLYYNKSDKHTKKLFSRKVKNWCKNKEIHHILADFPEYHATMQQILNKKNTKPYFLFPYYLVANLWMESIYIPVLKFIKHIKKIIYSHYHRGKLDNSRL